MLSLVLNLRVYRPRNQLNVGECLDLDGKMRTRRFAYTRTPLINSEKSLKCAYFSLISPSCVPLAAISRSLVIIFSVSPISIYRVTKLSAIKSIKSLIPIWILLLRKRLIKLLHAYRRSISFILSSVRYLILTNRRSIGFKIMLYLVTFIS
jgi:hypothetical protein